MDRHKKSCCTGSAPGLDSSSTQPEVGEVSLKKDGLSSVFDYFFFTTK